MRESTVENIAKLINSRNCLPEPLHRQDIYHGQYFFLEQDIPVIKKEEKEIKEQKEEVKPAEEATEASESKEKKKTEAKVILPKYPSYRKKEAKRDLIACVRAKRLSFYAYELKHLSVDPRFERKGFGSFMISLVEEFAIDKSVPLIMATSRIENTSVNALFSKRGYQVVKDFTNKTTNNACHIWQKVVC